jgi:tetratricopeptide (TPR) repeat protein
MLAMNIEQSIQLARQHHTAGRLREAEALYRQILSAEPNHAEALHLLGLVALQCGQPLPAIELMQRSIALVPGVFYFHNNLAEAFKAAGRFREAAAAFTRSLELHPDDPDTTHSLGAALEKAGDVEGGIRVLQETIRKFPKFAKPHMSLGAVFEHQARYDQALESFENAIALQPNYPKARAARAGIWLRRGEYGRGWEEYEWRWRVEKFPGRPPRPGPPVWDGSPLAGRAILLFAEQGLGDTIQFIRYAPMVAQRGGRVIVEAPKPLTRLLRTVDGVSDVVTPDQHPHYDVQLPILSLPRVMKTRVESIPANLPYVSAPPDVAQTWKDKIPDDGKKIGLCWAGGRSQPHRSIPAELIAKMIEGLPSKPRFYSLQKEHLPGESPLCGIIDLMQDVQDFADTAALTAHMDLILSIDTSVAHLAGAMARPTWLMLARHCDWRWFDDREDSPWYPSVRLFRQEQIGDWTPVVARVRAALHAL